MKNWKRYLLSVALLILVAILGVRDYFDSQILHNEWVVVYPGEEKAFIEYRVSLYELRKLLVENDLTLKEAVMARLELMVEAHPRSPKDCTLHDIVGGLQYGVLAQVYCDEFSTQ